MQHLPPWGRRERRGETGNGRRDILYSLANTGHFFL